MLIWRKFKVNDVELETPLPKGSGELLLQQITFMPKESKRAIEFDVACDLFTDAWFEVVIDDSTEAKDVQAFSDRWVSWISEQGFYIDLRGDEFEFLTNGAAA